MSAFVVLPAALGLLVATAQTAADQDAVAGRARSWRQKAMTYAAQVDDRVARNSICLAAARVLAQAGELAEAKAAAEQVLKPQTRVYAHSAVAKKYQELGDDNAALAVLLDCQQSFDNADADDRREGYEYLAKAYAERGFVREAQAAARHTRWPDHTSDSIAWHLAQRGDVEEALNLASSRILFSVAAQVAGWDKNERHVTLALAAARKVSTDEPADDALLQLVRALVKTKRLAEAAEFAGRIVAPLKQATARGIIAAAHAADETPDQIRSRIAAATVIEEKLPLYKLLVDKLIVADRFADAEVEVETLVDLIKANPRPDETSKFGNMTDSGRQALARTLHATIAAAYFKKGLLDDYQREVELAAGAVAEMDEQAGLGKVFPLMQVISVQLLADDVEGARETIGRVKQETMKQTGAESFHSFTISSMAGQVAGRLIQQGKIAEGLEVAEEIAGPMSGGPISEVARALIAAGRLDEAISQMRRLNIEDVRESAAEGIDPDEADARRSPGVDNRLRAYQHVGSAMAAAGLESELDGWLPEMPDDAARAAVCLGAAVPRK
jgi:tetratricopeptide (TPR) repeat protein